MSGGQLGGSGGPVKRVAWLFFAACLAVAVLGDVPRDPEGLWKELRHRSDQVRSFAADTVEWLGLTTDGSVPRDFLKNLGADPDPRKGGSSRPSSGSGDRTSLGGDGTGALAALPVSNSPLSGYNRDQWRHWDNLTPCWTVREQVLARDAVPGSLTLLDKSGRVTGDRAAACEVAGGKWVDPYTRQTYTNPSDLDIDHLVPLGEAARSGGQGWSETRKRQYANDLGYAGHLWAVSASANRQKSDLRPDQWQPVNRAIHCAYATSWVQVKQRWGLSVTTAERAALGEMLRTC